MMINNLSLVNILTTEDTMCHISLGQSEVSDLFRGRHDFMRHETRQAFLEQRHISFQTPFLKLSKQNNTQRILNVMKIRKF